VLLLYYYHITTVLLLITTLLLPLQANSQPNDLNDYLKTAAENNPKVQSTFNDYMAALERVPQVKSLPDLQVAFGYFISPVETRVGPQEMRFSATQMFPWFGELGARGEKATLEAKAKYEAFQEAKSKLFKEVKTTWYDLYNLEERIRITQENMALLRSFRQLAETRFETGKESMVDVIRVKMNLESLNNQLQKLRDERQPYREILERLLNEPLPDQVPMPDTMETQKLTLDKQALMDSIRQNNPRLEQLAKQSRAHEQGIEVAKKADYPDLGLGVNYITTGERNVSDLSDNGKDAFFPQLTIKLPLYSKQYKAQREEARYRLEATRQQQTDLENDLTARFEEAYQDYRDARRKVQLNQEQINRAQQAIDILMANYSGGNEDFEEILSMQDKLLEFQLGLANAVAQQNKAVAGVEYLMGREMK